MGHLQSPLMQLYQEFWTPFYSLCSAMTAAMFMRPQNREHSVPFLFFPLSVFPSFSEAPPPLCLSFLRLPLFNVLFIFLLFCSAYSSRHSPPPLSHVACCPSLVPSLFHSRCSLYSVVFFCLTFCLSITSSPPPHQPLIFTVSTLSPILAVLVLSPPLPHPSISLSFPAIICSLSLLLYYAPILSSAVFPFSLPPCSLYPLVYQSSSWHFTTNFMKRHLSDAGKQKDGAFFKSLFIHQQS